MSEILCGVCAAEPRKYKCPSCSLPYCSIQCFKTHKATHAELSDSSIPNAPTAIIIPEPLPPAPVPRYLKSKVDFSALATSPKFKDLLKTYPQLLSTLQRVYASTIEPDPEDQARRRMLVSGASRGRGYRGRGRGRGGRFGGSDDREFRWTQKKGDSDAMKALKRLRGQDTEHKEKDAMKTFVDLVEEMYGKTTKDGGATGAAT